MVYDNKLSFYVTIGRNMNGKHNILCLINGNEFLMVNCVVVVVEISFLSAMII